MFIIPLTHLVVIELLVECGQACFLCLPVINKEVDFIATNAEEKRYIQATESMNKPTTRERELAPLRMIRDNYEKIVIAGNCNHPITEDGIKIIRLTDFLLDI